VLIQKQDVSEEKIKQLELKTLISQINDLGSTFSKEVDDFFKDIIET